jgi:hypothetical protein
MPALEETNIKKQSRGTAEEMVYASIGESDLSEEGS